MVWKEEKNLVKKFLVKKCLYERKKKMVKKTKEQNFFFKQILVSLLSLPIDTLKVTFSQWYPKRQTDQPTDRQTNQQTEKPTNRQTDRPTKRRTTTLLRLLWAAKNRVNLQKLALVCKLCPTLHDQGGFNRPDDLVFPRVFSAKV